MLFLYKKSSVFFVNVVNTFIISLLYKKLYTFTNKISN